MAVPSLPFVATHPLEVSPELRALIEAGPVHRIRTAVGDPAWLVTGHDHVRALLADDRLGMAHPDPDRAARVSDSALFGGRPRANVDTEDAERARFRSLLQPYFAPGPMRALRARVEAMVEEMLDDMSRRQPPVDLLAALAVPLPVLVICELLGVPAEDRHSFRQHSQNAAAVADAERSQAGLTALWTYTRQLVTSRRGEPGGDVVSGLCRAEGGALDDDYIAMLAAMILFAGHETTVVQIGLTMALLLDDRELWSCLAADPSNVPDVVEECLRIASPGGGGVPRYPRVDIEVAGVPIPAGDLVLLSLGAANHDGTVYHEPYRLDPDRSARGQLSFGHGAHYCLGAPLARIELQAVVSTLAARFPGLRLAVPAERLRRRDDLLTGGLAELPVMW